ncbi:MAG TPA: hypothetical protein VK983_04125, partial [Candidatus Limnocylindrales bacterium]|nr:hypothetical protein [Candidatus Limnocylindrales bacterium]
MQDPTQPTSYNPPLQPHEPDAQTVPNDNADSRQAAADLIRRKVAAAYGEEPSAQQEMAEVKQLQQPASKHQAYMQQLSQSGKSLVEIQQAWHEYYNQLPNHEKYQVWQEFYSAQPGSGAATVTAPTASP